MDKLDELRLRYWRSLPLKAQDIAAQWERVRQAPGDRAGMAALHQHVHRLTGSAPAYGFEAVGALARPIDQRLSEWMRDDGLTVPATPAEFAAVLAGPIAALVDALLAAAAAELPPAQ